VHNEIGHGRAAAFGVGSVATVIFIVAPQTLLLFFLVDVLGVPPEIAGFAILVPKVWEVVLDPVLGGYSDRRASAQGRRWPLMVWGSILFPIGFALLFLPPADNGWQLPLVWVLAAYGVSTLAFVLFSVPYITMVGEISTDPGDRLRITAWRMAWVAVGVLIAGGLAPIVIDAFPNRRVGYAIAGAGLAAICFVGSRIALRAAHPFRLRSSTPSSDSVVQLTTQLLRSRSYRSLWLSYVVQMFAISINAALLPFFVAYYLGASGSFVGIVFLFMTLATIVGLPAVVWLGDRFAQTRIYALSLLLSAAGLLVNTLAGPDFLAPVFLAAVILGLGQAGGTSVPFALLPGVLELDDMQFARANAAALTGVWIAGEKLGLAAGGAVAGFMLSVIGFDTAAADQSASAIAALPFIFGAVPGFILLTAIVFCISLAKGAARSQEIANP
jgi:glycoside/pentoside/hexuronide:cation symporter, GPH family